MKKLIAGALLSIMACSASHATFNLPSIPETTYPDVTTNFNYGILQRTAHSSCYAMTGNPNTSPGILYAYSWSNLGTGVFGDAPGIAWNRRDAAGNLINQGFINGLQSQRIVDLDVAMYDDGANAYVVAAYYMYDASGITGGHYLNFYRWTPGGLVALPPLQLSSSTYGRISIDAHDRFGFAVVWQEGPNVQIRTGYATGGALNLSLTQTIVNADNGIIPDVAFQHHGTTQDELNVRIVYLDNGGNFVVSHKQFFEIQQSSSNNVLFDVDDVTPAPPYYTSSSANNTFTGSTLNIDCPDHYNYDNWAYVYQIDNNNIGARVRNDLFSTTSSYNLTSGTIPSLTPAINSTYCYTPTIAYSQDCRIINFGWYTNYQNKGYIAVKLKDDGFLATGYDIVSNTNTFSPSPSISFSKETSPTIPIDHLFVTYTMQQPSSYYYINYKRVPWTTPYFRNAPDNSLSENSAETITASPNPCLNYFALSSNQKNATTVYDVSVTGIAGHQMLHLNGTLADINKELSTQSTAFLPGLYFVNIKSPTVNQDIKIIKN